MPNSPARLSLHEMRRPEVDAALASGFDTVVATFGATEQHGLHLPMGTDSLWGEEIGRRVTEALGTALQAPGLRIGCSEHHMDFAGSLTLSNETFTAYVCDLCRSIDRHGFSNIVLIPTHGGNFEPLGVAAEAARSVVEQARIVAFSDLPTFVQILFRIGAEHGIDPETAGAHAGENETSMILALRPDLVEMSQAEAGFLGDVLAKKDVLMNEGFSAISEIGVLGDPAPAKPEVGEAYLSELTREIVEFVRAELG